MPPRRRPTAFEVSFPEEAAESTQDDSASGLDNRRRPHDHGGGVAYDQERQKRRKTDERPREPRHFQPRPDEILETEDLVVIGEDPDARDDGQKPTRILGRFAFFDPTQDLVMVSLSCLDVENDHRVLEGAGMVMSISENGEDEGQEDDIESEPQFIRITNVLGYSINYTEDEEPMYIETNHARYILGVPSKKYRREFRAFFKFHRIVQMVVSSAIRNPECQYRDFLKEFLTIDILGAPPSEQDLWDSVPELRYTLEGLENAEVLSASIVMRRLLKENAPLILKSVTRRPRPRVPPTPVIKGNGNRDLAVLRPENQSATRVTPRIAKLATGWFREQLVVVGPQPPREPSIPYDDLLLRVRTFVHRVSTRRDIRYRQEQRIRPRSRWLKYITIDNTDYAIGDTIIVAAGCDEGKAAPELPDPADVPETAILADYFWFGKIVYINEEYSNAHIEWFEHSTKTAMEQLGHPQELFLTDICSTIELDLIVGKVPAQFFEPSNDIPIVSPHNFFYKFIYNSTDGSFTEIPRERLQYDKNELGPDYCAVCSMIEEKEDELVPQTIPHGVAWNGIKYHVHDTVMIRAEEGPCHIGQIFRINFSLSDDQDSLLVRVKLFGRIDKLGLRPASELKDERHLFVTQDEMELPLSRLIGLCQVYVRSSVPDLEAWLEVSPYHFYARYAFPSLNVTSWNQRHRLEPHDLLVCGYCAAEDLAEWKHNREFTEKYKPLRALDPFSGSGSFGLAMEETGCVEVTHAIEISPSTARTMKANSPHTVVYNQCSNLVFEQTMRAHVGLEVKRLKKIDLVEDDDDIAEDPYIPAPPKKDEIDCIIAGFPCQSHSRLNMFVRANDRKSNLILNVLSWVDFIQPKYCFFENVRGFMSFNLKARQGGMYKVKGGIPMGGLKFLIRAMTDMNYQIRYGILQAAHYGTPQSRARFFMVAAKNGFPLPELPQPTHDFPVVDSLEIKFPVGHHIRPIRTRTGCAPHRFITIDDAISDLPRFDWENPRPSTDPVKRQEDRNRARTIPLKKCKKDRPWCGYSGKDVPYTHAPATAFQKWCRKERTNDLQQYTRTYEPIKVERVVSIPMEANADYRTLRPDLWEWQFANPSSAVARVGYRPGLYGRVDKDRWFQATVANVDPTAKQSRVLNPYCKRIFTVRELARSQGFPDKFVFYGENDRVMTMHRQIGNGVAWPVAVAIGREFRKVLIKKWLKERANAMEVD